MKVKNGAVERNIYVEVRGKSLRFVVQVSPFPKERATFDSDQFDSGLQWARRMRVELLEQKAKSKKLAAPVAAPVPPVIAAGWSPAGIRVSDVVQNFRVRELPHLAGAAEDASRLNSLEEWFGQLTLGELTYDLLKKWKIDRASGVLGFGRISYPPGYSKNDLYRIRKALKAGRTAWRDGTPIEMPTPITTPPSAQTIRHEMMLMRRALHAYFSANGLNEKHGTWLECQHVMQIALPEKPAPRDTRVDEEGLQALVRELDNPSLAAFARFAVMTTLRRSEVCSLRWEDLDHKKRTILLRSPGHLKKSKTSTREVPLLPQAVQILEKLGIQKKGPLFNITPSGISQAMRRAADRAGLYDLRLHDLRREGISRLLELLDASYEDVSLFSGHSDLKTLKEHYARPDPSKVRDRLEQHPAMARMMSAT